MAKVRGVAKFTDSKVGGVYPFTLGGTYSIKDIDETGWLLLRDDDGVIDWRPPKRFKTELVGGSNDR